MSKDYWNALSVESVVMVFFLAQSDAGWCVACAKCEAATGDYFKKHHAVKAWNTRNGHLYTADDFNQAAEERDYGL